MSAISAVAVVADSWWHAKTALDAVAIQWNEGEHANVSSESIDADCWRDSARTCVSARQARRFKLPSLTPPSQMEAICSYPFQNHACMEPMNATDTLHARALGGLGARPRAPMQRWPRLPRRPDYPRIRCDVHRVSLGGGFGRRLFTEHVAQAVLIAQKCQARR